ncbi:hypothetical protein L861_19930 [Litchfieldella anticariensis FP35 = DSM 16096]|uniref:Ancillary SecYEG translocon subunit n=1 Tax=Litchfieldella anticariensis (strain DSM 16096 / CECT 5854 / CIP 108499 / LMG 22089 / FP35) TaxID=1121939 RepID=S2KIJ3_LITA3|nr:tetratricopeptide repeat protein [Halomonas anticariensis]EPC01922.1 hypothetical protein L861_19930 [Halomonas anticariensis FP35 = DSM 16096]
MAELRTEEEQLEAIKRWWKENGKSLIAGVVIAAAGVLGWNAWKDYQANQAEAASMRYQQLISIVGQNELAADNRSRAQELIGEITDNHGDTLYADLAGLIEARLAVSDNDRAAAQAALGDVIENTPREYIRSLARLRLARLQLATDDPEAALATLDEEITSSLEAQRADIRGDAYLKLERDEDARDAYRQAMALAEEHNQPLYGVQLKLDNLGTQEATL